MTDSPVIDTQSGPVRGTTQGVVQAFKGIPYGAPTSGGRRFLPPEPASAWREPLDALAFGPDAPQDRPEGSGNNAATQNNMDLPPSEDCLRLNVYTPDPAGRRPVMFWLHGGGFVSGSGSGAMYDGTRLAERGDVVVVSINHRLGALGFLHLLDLPDPHAADAVNVGMLDILLALRWVQDNVSAFGGDPNNVTIFGESGGGRKVTSLLAMPDAQSLFHKGIIQSGPAVFMNEPDAVKDLARRFFRHLGLAPDQRDLLKALQAAPVDALLAAQGKVLRELGRNAPGLAQTFAPVVDGRILPHHPFDPEAPAISTDKPVIVGYNHTEITLFMGRDPDLLELDDEGLRRRIAKIAGDDAERLIGLYRDAYPLTYPEPSNADLLALIMTGNSRYPIDSLRLAERKAAQQAAPVWLYTLTYRTPAARGSLRTPHALEIPFVFDNIDGSKRFVGSGPDADKLAECMRSAWAAFAHSGKPQSEAVPDWPAYDQSRRATMLFDAEPRVVDDFGAPERAAFGPVFYPREHQR